MPVYSYKCPCGKLKDVTKKICEYKTDEYCDCNKLMTKLLNTPTITGMDKLGRSGIDKGGKIQ